MKWYCILFMGILACVSTTHAESSQSGKTLASTMDVYVFPKAGQDAAQQSQDEAACYEWAVAQVGHDPFELTKASAQQEEETEQAKAEVQESTAGSGARGALRGAAAGAIIGEIVDDDAGKGAAIGAGAGAISSRRRARRVAQDAQEQAEKEGETTQQSIQEGMEKFKKAFSVCLEAKDYLVKY